MPMAIGTASAIRGFVIGPWVRSFIVAFPSAERSSVIARQPAPPTEVAGHALDHALCRLGKPGALAAPEISENRAPLRRRPEVHIGGLPAHHPQQTAFIVSPWQAPEGDAAAVRR